MTRRPRSRPRSRTFGGVRPEAVPPDAGLQAERTSLSWARTWAVVAVNILLVARLVGEMSWAWAAAFSVFMVVPLVALFGVQRRHEQRVGRFVRAGQVPQTHAAYNLGLVAMVVVSASCGLAAILVLNLA